MVVVIIKKYSLIIYYATFISCGNNVYFALMDNLENKIVSENEKRYNDKRPFE